MSELCVAERNVGELLSAVGGSQPNLSHHLHVLLQAGVVKRRRDGVKVFYQLAPGYAELLGRALHELAWPTLRMNDDETA